MTRFSKTDSTAPAKANELSVVFIPYNCTKPWIVWNELNKLLVSVHEYIS